MGEGGTRSGDEEFNLKIYREMIETHFWHCECAKNLSYVGV